MVLLDKMLLDGDDSNGQDMLAILDKSTLDTITPKSQNVNLQDLLDSQSPREGAIDVPLASRISQRSHLYLDELVPVIVILQCPYVGRDAFEPILQRICLTLEAFAIGKSPVQQNDAEQATAQIKDLIDTKVVTDAVYERFIAVSNNEGKFCDESGRSLCLMWKANIHIARTAVRSLDPSIYFAVSLKLYPEPKSMSDDSEDEYLESGVPASVNLLAALQNVPEYKKTPPKLTVARLSKLVPTGAVLREQGRLLRNASRHYFPLRPALNTRIQYHHIGVSPSQIKILASLNIEVSSFIGGKLTINRLNLDLEDGTAELLGASSGIEMPIRCSAQDSLALVYNLRPKFILDVLDQSQPYIHSISFNLEAATYEYQSQQEISNDPIRIQISWRTNIDLAPLIRQSFPMKISENRIRSSLQSQSTSEMTNSQLVTNVYSGYLISLTVSGPSRSYLYGSPIQWSLLLVNRSTTRTLNLAIIPLTFPSSPSAPSYSSGPPNPKRHRHKATLSTSLFTPSAPKQSVTAPSSSQANSLRDQEEPDLIPLTPDIRIGPLAPGKSATAEIKFLALKSGVLRVQALRIVDLDIERQRNSLDVDHEKTGTYRNKMLQRESGTKDRGKEKVYVDVESEMLPDIVVDEGTGGEDVENNDS